MRAGAPTSRVSLPVLVTVTVRASEAVDTGWFPKAIELGDTPIVLVVPSPSRDTSCPATVSVPLRGPGELGEKTTSRWQLAPAPSWLCPRPPQPWTPKSAVLL